MPDLEVRRRDLPDGLPLALRRREYGLEDPNASPGATVEWSLADFRRELKQGKAELIPWLQDFPTAASTGSEVKAQIEAARLMGARGYLLWNHSASTRRAPWHRLRNTRYTRGRMAIGDVMRTRVVTVAPGDSARLAVLRMLEEAVGSVAVCDGGRPSASSPSETCSRSPARAPTWMQSGSAT